MVTIGIADLKSHLSAELKKVLRGETLVVLDHRRAIAHVVPVPEGLPLTRRATTSYECQELVALVPRESLIHFDEERAERW